MKSNSFLASRVVRAGMALIAATSLAVVAAPESAQASCSSVPFAKYNSDATMAWKMIQDSSCTHRWGRIVVDYQPDPTGIPLAIKIERQISSPYGWYDQAVYTKISGVGAEGTWNTSKTANTGSDDRHKLCWGYAVRSGSSWVAPSSWGSNCSGWL